MSYKFEDAVEYTPAQEGDAPKGWEDGMPWDCSGEPVRFAKGNYTLNKFRPAWNFGTTYLVPREAVKGDVCDDPYPFEDGVEYVPVSTGRAPQFWDDSMPWDRSPFSRNAYYATSDGATWEAGTTYLVPRQAIDGTGAVSKPVSKSDSSDPSDPYPFCDAVEFRPGKEGVGPKYWSNHMPWDVRSASGQGQFEEEFCDYDTVVGDPSWHTDSIYLVPRQAVFGRDGGWGHAPEPQPQPVRVDPVASLAQEILGLNEADRARLNNMLTGSF